MWDGPEKDGLAWYWKTSRTDETGGKEVRRVVWGRMKRRVSLSSKL